MPAPYAEVAQGLELSEDELCTRLQAMKDTGVIRRIAAAPNHYKLGMVANGMTVWDVDDAQLSELGPLVGALDFVSHCYERPRDLPEWPYNLFAMVHGSSRDEVEEKRARITDLSGRCAERLRHPLFHPHPEKDGAAAPQERIIPCFA